MCVGYILRALLRHRQETEYPELGVFICSNALLSSLLCPRRKLNAFGRKVPLPAAPAGRNFILKLREFIEGELNEQFTQSI